MQVFYLDNTQSFRLSTCYIISIFRRPWPVTSFSANILSSDVVQPPWTTSGLSVAHGRLELSSNCPVGWETLQKPFSFLIINTSSHLAVPWKHQKRNLFLDLIYWEEVKNSRSHTPENNNIIREFSWTRCSVTVLRSSMASMVSSLFRGDSTTELFLTSKELKPSRLLLRSRHWWWRHSSLQCSILCYSSSSHLTIINTTLQHIRNHISTPEQWRSWRNYLQASAEPSSSMSNCDALACREKYSIVKLILWRHFSLIRNISKVVILKPCKSDDRWIFCSGFKTKWSRWIISEPWRNLTTEWTISWHL